MLERTDTGGVERVEDGAVVLDGADTGGAERVEVLAAYVLSLQGRSTGRVPQIAKGLAEIVNA